MNLKEFFTSGWEFQESERDVRSKYQMMNIAIILSSVAVFYGVIINLIEQEYTLGFFEFILLCMNGVLFYLLRISKSLYDFVSVVVTAQFSFLLILLLYVSKPDEMKHTWFFTYPIIMLYFRNDRYVLVWFLFMIAMILLAPLQPFVQIDYSFFQAFYLAFVLSIVSIIVFFYREKMVEARRLIEKQERLLSKKVEELTQKDKMLTLQSKQAVMGEMISMIAHQWRQPLSTVTLSISNLQLKKLLGEKIEEQEVDTVLETVSETVVYLSETIDDFKTYFQPNKELNIITLDELLSKVVHFIQPRLQNNAISIEKRCEEDITLHTYANELVQVLLNIVNNAVDEFLERNIKNAKLSISTRNAPGYIIISIADNAGGIRQNDIYSIFEPYVSTKGKNGTGLGLYMSQMIMEKQFGSKIEVQSDTTGSIFSIKIPKKLA